MAGWKSENGRSPSAAAKRAHAVFAIDGYLDGLVPRKVVPMLDKLWLTANHISSPKRPMRRLFHIRRVLSPAGGVEAEGVGGFRNAGQNFTGSPQPTLLLTPR